MRWYMWGFPLGMLAIAISLYPWRYPSEKKEPPHPDATMPKGGE